MSGLSKRDRAALANIEACERSAEILGERIAGRVHVGASVRALLREVRGGFAARIRRAPEARTFRRATYLAALRAHSFNRAEYRAVTSGQFNRRAPVTAERKALSAELARYGG